ncbi:MerR family transcriptional regulator [Paenibacillus tritici]|jgi:MerR family transcriptional regulator, copper efflux regulator|uniref:MerR family transcriptional regulator n=1 Tax=Paenibacillus tritici TaxID=1873425 RepID=A0ABX2DTJ4_9BACL|nr:MerR family transcriptional regulator [Paenibacillus tritici]NQX48012.1 MerR family transcriptional regulator [Paenibacillus tritici]
MSLADKNPVSGYSIKETAERTGITEDTIRYYEKIGLLPRAQRKGNSHRIYSEQDLEMMKLITCLKKTGMSLDDMRPFLNLSLDSDLSQYPELHEMILTHKQKILEQIASLQQVVDFIDNKVEQGSLGPQACELTGDTRRRMPARSKR